MTTLRPQGRIIALCPRARVVVNYDDFAGSPPGRHSIEDKSFESHWASMCCASPCLVARSAQSGASGRLHSHMQLARNLFLSAIALPRARRRKPISPSRLSAPSQNSRSSPSMATDLLAAACTVLRRLGVLLLQARQDVTLTELRCWLLAQGPVAYSPLLNPEKALRRRNLVLSEMESTASSPPAAEQGARLRGSSYHPARNVRCPWFQKRSA